MHNIFTSVVIFIHLHIISQFKLLSFIIQFIIICASYGSLLTFPILLIIYQYLLHNKFSYKYMILFVLISSISDVITNTILYLFLKKVPISYDNFIFKYMRNKFNLTTQLVISKSIPYTRSIILINVSKNYNLSSFILSSSYSAFIMNIFIILIMYIIQFI